MWKVLILSLVTTAWAVENVTITEPVDGATYDGDWLTVRAIVENDDELPDSVHHTLNGEPFIPIPRLNTDWYTYMQNDLHHGFSESPAPTDNTILWTAAVTGNYHEFPTPVVVDGIVYYPSNYGSDSLYALDAATGELIWKYRTGYTDDAVTVKEGYLYTASDSLWCLDALTGERIWATNAADADGSTPAVVDGRVYCGRASYSQSTSYIYCFDAVTGTEMWSQTLSGYTASCLTVWNGMVFIPTYTSSLYALDANTGSITWENIDSNGGYWDSSPVVVDDLIYISGIDSKTRAIDAMTGTTIWAVDITPGTYISATPAYHDGRLYFGDQVDAFHCLDTFIGSSIWSVPGVEHGSSGIADGMVFYGEGSNYYDESARVIALNCETGQEVWSYMTTSGPFGIVSSPAITDGVMYIAATDGNLYAFGTGLKYTYLDDLFADVGANELIVTSFYEDIAVAADTINFTVTGTGINLEPSCMLGLCASPNPFSSSLRISYYLPEAAEARLAVYDLSGRLVENLETNSMPSGEHILTWNPEPSLPDGCYIIVLDAGGERAVRRCVKL